MRALALALILSLYMGTTFVIVISLDETTSCSSEYLGKETVKEPPPDDRRQVHIWALQTARLSLRIAAIHKEVLQS